MSAMKRLYLFISKKELLAFQPRFTLGRLTSAVLVILAVTGCGGGGDDSIDEVSQIINGATRASAGSHWLRSLTQSTERIAFYSDGTGDYRPGGSCSSGALAWTKTSGTSLSANLPPTGGTSSCPTVLVLTNINAGGGSFSATSTGSSTLTWVLVGTKIP